jgi:hypothetical protein
MTQADLIRKALRTINAFAGGEDVPPNDLAIGQEVSNDMLDAWAAIRLTIYQTLRNVYPMTAGKGSPSNPYTIGPGGDLNQVRPLWIPNANVLNRSVTPNFEMPLNILKDDAYFRTSIKVLTSSLCTDLYYNSKFDTSGAAVGLGQIFLYPVPDGTYALSLVLYIPTPLTQFVDLATTDYTFPPGYAEALRYQLAIRLAVEFGRPISPELAELARTTFGVIQRPNARAPLLRVDRGMAGLASGSFYNWRTGSNDRRGD